MNLDGPNVKSRFDPIIGRESCWKYQVYHLVRVNPRIDQEGLNMKRLNMSTFAAVLALLSVMVLGCAEVQKPSSDDNFYEHPSRLFVTQVPAGWIQYKQSSTPYAHIVTFRPPEGYASLTISVVPGLLLPEELPLDVVSGFFPKESPLSKVKRIRGQGWNAIRQDLTGRYRNEEWTWLAIFYGIGQIAVNVTLSDSSEFINDHRSDFNQLIQSMSFDTTCSKPPHWSFSDQDFQKIISHAQNVFWKKAIVGPDLQRVHPTSESERNSLLIPKDEAWRIVNDAIDFGLAYWCEIEWRPVYLAYMQLERRKGWQEKQIAFIGVLFGSAQASLNDSMKGDCVQQDRIMAKIRLGMKAVRLRELLELE
jgi:hypothetical protein